MKVLLYSEGLKLIARSGLGRAIEHQKTALGAAGVSYTTDPNDSFDLVHINTYFLKSRSLVRKWKRQGIPIVYHAHSTEEDFRNSFLFSNTLAPLFRRWIVSCYNLGDVVVTPTLYSKGLLEKAGVDKPLYAVSNGIDLNYFRKQPEMRERFRKKYHFRETDRVIMSVGVFIKRKGILDFVELAKRMPECQFVWFGDLNLMEVPREIRQAVRTELPNLLFAGYVNPQELRDAYAGADLFFFPTYEETEGIVLLEAMAMEQTILIRDIPIYEEFTHGKDLWKGKSIEDFEQIMRQFFNQELPSVTVQARKNAAAKDIAKIGLELKKVYQEAILMGKSPT